MPWRRLGPYALVFGVVFGGERVADAEDGASARCGSAAPGAYQHDGFYLHAETGVALLSAHVADSPRGRSRVRGIGQSGGIALGAAIAPGLTLGGNIWTARIDPSFVENGVSVVPDDDSVKLTLGSLGPFLEWYPNPYRGFHLQSSAAVAIAIETDVKGEPLRPPALGAKFALGAGYEWFVSPQFSLGFLVRMNVLADARPRPEGPERTLAEIPELLLSSTYN